jgi:glycosyltransferase involved in cell wall biosynthesis
VPKLRDARIILDQHDPMPELMRTIFGLGEQSFGTRLLKLLEKASIGFADQVITVNLACKSIFSKRSCRPEKIEVVMNSPDEQIFAYARFNGSGTRDPARPFVMMYHGSIVERHGLDLAVQAVQDIQGEIPNLELRIYGAATPFLDSVMASVKQAGLDERVRYFGPKPLEEIAQAIRDCDLGLIPNRQSVFTEINTPTRIFEYLALGRPVIAPRVPGITDYFAPDDLVFFELGNPADLVRQILYVYSNPEAVRMIGDRGQAIYQKHCWTREKQRFVSRVGDLLNPEPQSKPIAR